MTTYQRAQQQKQQGASARSEASPVLDYGSNQASAGTGASQSATPWLDAAGLVLSTTGTERAPAPGGNHAPGDSPVPGGASPFEAELTEALGRGADFAALDRLVASAPLEERKLAYRSTALHQAIAVSALLPAEQLALATALSEGSLKWASIRAGGSDFFEFFIIKDAKGPAPEMQDMNCWELILYSAWKLGHLSTEWICTHYEKTVPNFSFDSLGFRRDLPLLDAAAGRHPAVGDLVFVSHRADTNTAPDAPPSDADLAKEPWHVVLALGGDASMSLWRPDAAMRKSLSDYTQRGELIRFGPAPW